MNITKVTLYKARADGKFNIWEVHATDFEIFYQWGVEDGAFQELSEIVPYGKANRTREEQTRSQIGSKIAKQFDHGYRQTKQEALAALGTNALGFPKPMLADKYPGLVAYASGHAYQYKYDGHRCLITRHSETENIAYSRNGKHIDSITEVLRDLPLIPGGVVLDGELYAHGVPLQTITSWIKRRQDSTAKLKYVVYDAIIVGEFYDQRYTFLRDFLPDSDHIELARTIFNFDPEDIPRQLESAIADGYEGLIVRLADSPYVSRRSKGLLKVKQFDDSEFKIKDIYLSPKDVPIVECDVSALSGKTFTVTAPGSHEERNAFYRNRDDHIGCLLTVKYSGWTKDKIPFHPIAIGIKEDI